MNATGPLLFSFTNVDALFDQGALHRGERYQQEGRVSHLHITQAGKKISAQIEGKTESFYKVNITIVPQIGTPKIQGICSCYVGYNCKHVAATLLEALAHAEPEAGHGDQKNAPPRGAELLQSKFLSSAPVRPTATPASAHWFSFLENIKQNTPETREPLVSSSAKQALIYILNRMDRYNEGEFLRVDLKLVNVLKKGRYGSAKPFWPANPKQAEVLTPDDVLIAHHLQVMSKHINAPGYAFGGSPLIGGPMARDVIAAIIATQRCHWQQITGPKLVLGEPLKAEFAWAFLGNGLQQLRCQLKNKIILPTQPLWYLDEHGENHTAILGPVTTQVDDRIAIELMTNPPLTQQEAAELKAAIMADPDSFYPMKDVPLPIVLVSESKKGTPIPYVKLVSNPDDFEGLHSSAIAMVYCQYDDVLVDPTNETKTLEYQQADKIISVQRNHAKELRFLQNFKQKQVKLHSYSKNAFEIGLPFMFEDLPDLREQGWIVDIDAHFPLQCAKEDEWYTEVDEQFGDKTQYDWFGFELGIMVDGEKINVLPLLVNLIAQNPAMLKPKHIQEVADDYPFHLQLPDKRYIEVEAKRIKQILFVLVELYDSKALIDGKVKVDYVQAAQLLGLQQALRARWMGPEKIKKLGEKLSDFTGIVPCEIPKGFHGELRAYQKEGFDWLNFLREFQLGGILADDMGLGKTVQVLTHLLSEKEAGRQKYPNLIIAPTSLMANWYNECKRFTPDLKMLTLQGTSRHSDFENILDADIILSTYPLMHRDKAILLSHQFYYLILDEAQYIKNPNTKSYQALLELKAQHTLCMTGTPMENHLGELWALFHFTVPGLLGDSKQFKRSFKDPIEKEGDVARQKSLAQRVKPFMLRRTKSQVATELPAKTEIIHSIELTGSQLDLYEGIRLAMQAKVVSAVKQQGFMRSQIVILDALLKLRQTCNDPRLLPFMKDKAIEHSAKREFLMDMLDTLIEEGRKILLFSSFASMLKLIEQELIEKKIKYVILTGQTKDRATPIAQFQEGDTPVMLISLKAGGVGLNLTAADTVIHYDPWWNPAAEAQATDRAHRIGQTKPVFVYKLVCKGTVEEKILKMQENKKQLLSGLFKEGEKQAPKLSAQDLEYLFEPIT